MTYFHENTTTVYTTLKEDIVSQLVTLTSQNILGALKYIFLRQMVQFPEKLLEQKVDINIVNPSVDRSKV